MLDKAPGEPEWQSWCYLAIGVLAIYCTIPVARAVRNTVAEIIGLEFFLYLTIALTLSAGVMAFISLRKRNLPTRAYFWLFGIVAAFMAYIYQLRDIPEEAIHVAQYGAIGLLVYRALSHRTRDYSIYIMATLIVGIIGVLDEYIQWVAPSRYFDLRDIRTNILAGGLGQFAIVAGLRPGLICKWPDSASWSRLSYILSASLLVLVLGFLNTPQRIAWYASEITPLSFLLDSKSMMVEYGYRYHDENIGIFRSRFSPEQLEQLNRDRGEEVADIFDNYIRGEGYKLFLDSFTVPRDAYVHEAGVHLFRRDRYFDRAQEPGENQAEHFKIAHKENSILSKYFSDSLYKSGHRWSEEKAIQVKSNASSTPGYQSAVSAGVITRLSEAQVIALFSIAIAGFWLIGFFTGRIRKMM